jgi:putative MATE family efflux protein
MTSPTDPRTRRLGEESVGRLLVGFSLPAIAGMVVGSLYTVIDRAFLGNVVGPAAIAGIAVSMPISFVMMAFGMLLGVGTGAIVSIRLGQNRGEEAEAVLGNAFALILVGSITLTTVLLLGLDRLLLVFGASPATLPYGKQFMRIILLGSFFQYASFSLNAVIRAEGNPRLAMMTMLINAGLNIALDALFIPVLGLGITGAAVATVLSQAVSAAWTLAHFRSRRSVLKLRLVHLRVRWEVIRPALAIGLAPFSMHLGASVIFTLVNRALARYGGDVAIGAYGIIGPLSMLILMPIFGLNQGAQPIIGYNFGAGRLDRVRRTLRLAVLAATATVCVGFVLAQAIPGLLIHAFAPDPRLVEVGTRGLRICLAMFPVVGFQIVSANFFQAIGKARVALVLSLLRQVIVLIPLLVVLPRFLGLDGVWVAGPISDTIACAITGGMLAYQLRRLRANL